MSPSQKKKADITVRLLEIWEENPELTIEELLDQEDLADKDRSELRKVLEIHQLIVQNK